MSVRRLQELGFKESDCIKALKATSGRLEASATWLLENATPVYQAQTSKQQENAQGWKFAGFEVSTTQSSPTCVFTRTIFGTEYSVQSFFDNRALNSKMSERCFRS